MLTEIAVHLIAAGVGAAGGSLATVAGRILLLDARLTGKWEGDLRCDDRTAEKSATHIIRCILILARPVARQNSGFLYYQRECTHEDKVLVRGLDELQDYKRVRGYLRTPELSMIFVRRFHKEPSGQSNDTPMGYQFDCRLTGLMSRAPKLYVRTQVPNSSGRPDAWSGILQKH